MIDDIEEYLLEKPDLATTTTIKKKEQSLIAVEPE